MDRLYFFPTRPAKGYNNPYCDNYKKAIQEFFEVEDDSKLPKALNYPLLHYSVRADVFVLNWIESAIFTKFGLLKCFLALLSLIIIQCRMKKIVWMLHNIHPHQGENWVTKSFERYLYRYADLIVTHSQEAAKYARGKAKCDVVYVCHPVEEIKIDDYHKSVTSCDILIWGTVLPYKGIYELISQECVRTSGLRIRIVGICKDKALEKKINSKCNDNITYENRKISFPELKASVNSSRFVLFPYVGASVSSSGALIDTIVMGGNPVGPDMGAFRDLKEESVCLTYKDYPDIINLAKSEISIKEDRRISFISNNTWQNFAHMLYLKLK